MSITNETRRESYHAVLETLTERQKAVLQVLKERGGLTAQETAAELHRRGLTPTDERNFAAPRLTELSDKGLVKAVGKKKCYKTGRNVTVWSAAQPADAEMRAWLGSLERGGKGGRSE
jgi:predicted ArsR family transcriptional regulator